EAAPRSAASQAPLDLCHLALPWMTLPTAAAADFYTAVSGHEGSVLQISLTGILAVMLTANMIFERREFLEMLTQIEASHSTLNREFKTALAGIQRSGKAITDAERVDGEEERRLAGDIHREAMRIDNMLQ